MRNFIRLLFLLVFLLFFLPLLGVGYTTNDETNIYFFYKYSFSNFPTEIFNSYKLAFLNLIGSPRPTLPLLIVGPVLALLSAAYHDVFWLRLASIFGHALNLSLFFFLIKNVNFYSI